MEGGTHQFALPLLAAVHIHLHRLNNSVVFGKVFAVCHAETVGSERAGRQQPNMAKVGRHCMDRPASSGSPAFLGTGPNDGGLVLISVRTSRWLAVSTLMVLENSRSVAIARWDVSGDVRGHPSPYSVRLH